MYLKIQGILEVKKMGERGRKSKAPLFFRSQAGKKVPYSLPPALIGRREEGNEKFPPFPALDTFPTAAAALLFSPFSFLFSLPLPERGGDPLHPLRHQGQADTGGQATAR